MKTISDLLLSLFWSLNSFDILVNPNRRRAIVMFLSQSDFCGFVKRQIRLYEARKIRINEPAKHFTELGIRDRSQLGGLQNTLENIMKIKHQHADKMFHTQRHYEPFREKIYHHFMGPEKKE